MHITCRARAFSQVTDSPVLTENSNALIKVLITDILAGKTQNIGQVTGGDGTGRRQTTSIFDIKTPQIGSPARPVAGNGRSRVVETRTAGEPLARLLEKN